MALDLQLRARPWGFSLAEVRQPVRLSHCRTDDSVPFRTAELSAALLPNARLEIHTGGHFSAALLELTNEALTETEIDSADDELALVDLSSVD